MINRNWVMKRKRRKPHSGPDLSNHKEDNSGSLESPGGISSAAPAKRQVKTDVNSGRSSSKQKGNDGYYYECVICDVGGDLLCCDSCPRTYHIGCLNPPLKRIPMGKWLCPKCSHKNDALRSLNHLDSIAKRARTKSVKITSQVGSKSCGVGSSTISGEQSLGKGKSVVTTETKSLEKEFHPYAMDGCPAAEAFGTSTDGQSDSSCQKEDDLRKPDTARADPPSETRSILAADEELSESKLTNPEQNDEASKMKLEPDCNEVADKKKAVGVGKGKGKAKKRKLEFSNDGNLKKCRTDKGNLNASICKKSLSQGGSMDTRSCKLAKQKKKRNHLASRSLSKEESSMERQGKMGKLPKEDSRALDNSDKPSGYVVDRHCLPAGLLQVDRVLGCRIQGRYKISSHGTLSNGLYPDNVSGGENWGKHLEEGLLQDTNIDIGLAENKTDFFPETGKGSEDEACSKNVDCADKTHAYKRSVAKECSSSNSVNLLKVENKDSPIKDKDTDESAVVTHGLGERNKKLLMEENADIALNRHDENEELKVTETCVSDGTEILKEGHQGPGENGKVAEEKVEEPVIAKTSCPHEETLSYEFLVKWVGKSHIHNSWISESDLKVLAKRKLENYKSKYGAAVLNICEDKWKQPQRVIALRGSKEDKCEAYVKWTGLTYDECTWESLEEPVIQKASHLINLYEQFEQKTLEKGAAKDYSLRGRGENQQNEIVTLTEQPVELKGGSLFPHQLEALNWLRRCWYKSKNVILADEMGLGKTVSACAFLSSLYFEFKVEQPCLVLVPLSTMPNWLSEFSLWAPSLNVVEYHGGAKARAIIREYEWHANDPRMVDKRTNSYKFDVLLTTYEMVLADSSHLRGVPWEVLLVDEGHRLKNSESKLFSLLNTFSFQHRVLLTGTPLQNNIGEMYNLLNFLQPSSFPSLSSFEEKFHDLTATQKVEELKKLVAPHMLRRLKKDAMRNIPPKTERMVPVELTSIQAEYYRAMLTKNYQILRNIGKGVAQQSMLNIVMQLRKVCNHPYLIPGTEPESGSMEFLHEMRIKASAKLTLLHSMLKVLRKEGHRVLIFSQMTKLLDILEDYLNVEFGPKTFERVDGSVSVADRQAAIMRFNQDKSRFVFLLSTRSCGLGINLATADTVIIYDSDFNPHADIQAMNRAHRIGQSNRLLVYRLVVRASVEERILQLAKKKLMLDQLFVNKSGSQKEFEDILRWGTEELFNDSPGEKRNDACESNGSIGQVILDFDCKSRKKGGGLGDVYQDKCTDGNGKILWDEHAIMKLLDRSNLQSGSCDGPDTDFENDMLGSVKPLEWNEEAAEEQGGAESPAPVVDDSGAQSLERKEDNVVNVTEENEWDRLLRVRWKKYQSEEEAALGRGKRLRKAISYREAYAPHHSEALSESGGENDKGPEPEPKKEYTPAGRALKEKFAKLRARQKKRLAERNSVEESLPYDTLNGSECHANCGDADQAAEASDQMKENPSVIDLEDNKAAQQSDVLKGTAVSALGLRCLTKLKIGNSSDLPSQHHQELRGPPAFPPNNLLPVLGLCAPNFSQSESSRRNSTRSSDRQSRTITGPEFPFSLPPATPGQSLSLERGAKDREPVSGKLKSSDTQEEAPHLAPRNNANLDGWLPLHPFPPVAPPKDSDRPQISGSTFTDFRERFPLPNFPFDDKLLPRFPFPLRIMGTSHQDLLPNLSLGNRFEGGVDNSMQDHLAMPPMPFLSNLKIPPLDPSVYHQQEKELPPLGLDQLPSKFSSIPENHRKILENIMLRTGSGVSQFNKRTRVDAWSEDELDSLWVGVRRHGHGNWETILRDPCLKFSKFKTPEYLAARWEEEQRKFLEGLSKPSKQSKAAKSTRSSLFPGLPEGMMNRALYGAKFVLPPFQPHLTDMKLGFSDLTSTLPPFEQSDHLGLQSEFFPATTPLCPDNLPGDSSAGPSERPGSSLNLPGEKPFPLNSLGMDDVGSLVLSSSSALNTQRKEDEQNTIKRGKLPCFLDRPFAPALDSSDNIILGRSTDPGLVLEQNRAQNLSHFKDKDLIRSSSSENKLPHWLRDAVIAPVTKPPEPHLPASVSAIAQSVRVLYGEDRTTIPPFVVPEPPPPVPKDPRYILREKKKRRSHSHPSIHMPTDVASGSQNIQLGSQGNDLLDQLSLSVARTSGLAGSNLPCLSENREEPCSSAANSFPTLNTSMGLSLSPEMLQLVASCTAPGPSFQGTAIAIGSSSSPESKSSNPKSTSQVGDSEHKAGVEKTEPDQLPPHSGKLPDEKREEQGSEDGDPNKSQPEPTMAEHLNADEKERIDEDENEPRQPADVVVSSEGTV